MQNKRFRKIISLFICITVLLGTQIMPVSTAQAKTYVVLNVDNDAGDTCYFDSNYCYTSGNARYNNLSYNYGDNYMEFYRLDYTNPKRKSFMYAERTETKTYCFFTVNLNRSSISRFTSKTYKHILIESDIMTTLAGCEAQMFLIRNGTTDSDTEFCPAYLGADGSFTFSDGTVSEPLLKVSQWSNYKLAVNLETLTADVYFNGVKIKADLPISSDFKAIKQVRFRLMEGGTGNMYLNNFRITGLIEPYTDGVETPTDIYPSEDKIKEFLEGKVAFHGYSGLVYKNGIKRKMCCEPIYDTKIQELYICSDEIKTAFGISSLSAEENGSVTADGTTKTLSRAPVIKNGKTYIPLTAFSVELLGKYVNSFKTGYFIVDDENEALDTKNWVYQSFRSDSSQITLWNDVDFLNAFLQYERPDAARLKADFEAVNGNSHPRVLVNKSDFNRLRNAYNNDENYNKIATGIINSAKSLLNQPVAEYVFDDDMRMLNTASKSYQRFFHLGYAWQITGDTRYADRAYKEICALAEFPDYNTSHIIDAGEFAMALAVAYDWFYDAFTEEQREFALKVCVEKGLEPLASGMYGRLTSSSNGTQTYGAFRWRSNYNAIVVGGCLNAAVAGIEYDPDYCFDIIENCLKGYEYTLAELMPGGGWNEAPGYWNYAMQYLNVGLSTLNTAFGSDYCLSKSMGMEKTLDFAVATLGATGPNNFHDMGSSSANSYGEFMYLTKLYGNKTAFELRYNDIIFGRAGVSYSDIIHYDSTFHDSLSRELDTVNYVDGVELFSVRDSFDAANDEFFFSTHFGTTNGYHQHYDCSTFVLDINGVRWAEDLGSDNYNLQNELGNPEHSIYRKRSEGHNVMVINPADYANTVEQVKGKFVPVEKYAYNDTEAYVIADMSEVYDQASSMKLGYYVDRENQAVTMRNEFVLDNNNSEVYWFMHTKADVTIEDNVAYLTRGSDSVKLEFDAGYADALISVMEAKPLPTSPQVPEQNPNTDYCKVAIKLNASGHNTLTVRVSPVDYTEDMLQTPLKDWHLISEKENDVVLFEGNKAEDFNGFIRGTHTDEAGIGGKTSDDNSVAVTIDTQEYENNYNAYYNYLWGNVSSDGVWSEADGSGYLIASANVFSKLGTTTFSLKTDQSGFLSTSFTPKANSWHNITVIYDRATGLSKTIIDGVHGEYKDCMLGKPRNDGTSVRNSIRFSMAAKNQNDVMYIDDVKIYTSDIDYVPSMPEISHIFRVDGSLIQCYDGFTPDVIAANSLYDVRVYSDNTFTTQLSGDTALAGGNVVVLSDTNNLYNTYTITSAKLHTPSVYKISQTYGFAYPLFNLQRASATTLYGTGGKAASDEVVHLVGNSENSGDDFYFQHAYNAAETAYDTAMSMDIYIDSSLSMKNVFFATGGHAPLSSTYSASKLSPGSWHNIALIHRADTNVNEIYIDEALAETKTLAISSNTLRFIIKPLSALLGGNNATNIYADNIVYLYGEDIILDPISSASYTVNGAYISGATGKTVSDFTEATIKKSTAFTLEIYNTDGALASESASITAGMYVYVKENENILRQYYFK